MFLVSVAVSNCLWERVPGGRSRTAERTLGKCCAGERFGQSSGRGRAYTQWRFYTFVTVVAQGVAQDVLGVAPKVFIYIQITE